MCCKVVLFCCSLIEPVVLRSHDPSSLIPVIEEREDTVFSTSSAAEPATGSQRRTSRALQQQLPRAAAAMFKNSYQSGFLSILYSIGSKPLQIWDKEGEWICGCFPVLAAALPHLLSHPHTSQKPLTNKTVHNGHIKRLTDADIQSSVLEIMSSNVSTTYITTPADPAQTLGIKVGGVVARALTPVDRPHRTAKHSPLSPSLIHASFVTAIQNRSCPSWWWSSRTSKSTLALKWLCSMTRASSGGSGHQTTRWGL